MSVSDEIDQLAGRFSGHLGLWAYCPDTEETISHNGDELFPAASTLKLMVLFSLFKRAELGVIDLAAPLTLPADAVVGGSGVLQDLTPGLTLSVQDMATLMIVISDNTAANLMVDLVGLGGVNDDCNDLGLTQTNLDHKFNRWRSGDPPNTTSPENLGQLMWWIAGDQVLTAEACAGMRSILQRQHEKDYITRHVADFYRCTTSGEPVATVACKEGLIDGVRNTVGHVRARGRQYVIAMMTRDCADRRYHPDNEAVLLLHDLSALIYRYFVPGGN